MGDHEAQSWPLAPEKIHQRSDDEENPAFKTLRKERTSKCFVYVFSFLILSLIVLLIFSLVALRPKPPAVKLRAVHVTRLRYTANSFNLTLVAEVSIRNPNFGPFRYEANNSAAVFYGGGKVGERRLSGGELKVRAVRNMNVTVDVRSSMLPEGKNYLERDLSSGTLNLTTFSRFSGRVHMLGAFKTRKTKEMSCQMTLVLKTRQIKNLIC